MQTLGGKPPKHTERARPLSQFEAAALSRGGMMLSVVVEVTNSRKIFSRNVLPSSTAPPQRYPPWRGECEDVLSATAEESCWRAHKSASDSICNEKLAEKDS
eukprot:1831851-Amphidinium_carterae.1